jgi:hypothetical protein
MFPALDKPCDDLGVAMIKRGVFEQRGDQERCTLHESEHENPSGRRLAAL